jgi:hypothetical protein
MSINTLIANPVILDEIAVEIISRIPVSPVIPVNPVIWMSSNGTPYGPVGNFILTSTDTTILPDTSMEYFIFSNGPPPASTISAGGPIKLFTIMTNLTAYLTLLNNITQNKEAWWNLFIPSGYFERLQMGGLWGDFSVINVSFSVTIVNQTTASSYLCTADCDGLVIRIFPEGVSGDVINLNGFALTIVAYTGPPS